MNHIWALNHFFSISTNGVAYLETKVQNLLRRNYGRMSIAITIDGNKELHDSCRKFPDGSGSYDMVEKAMKQHLATDYLAHTKLTLAPSNIQYLFNAVTHLFDLGLPSVFANCVFERGWNVEHSKVFYNQLVELADYMLDNEIYREHCTTLFTETIGQPLSPDDNQNWCGGTGNMLAIDTDGEIYPCLRYVPFSLKEGCVPLTIGNIDDGIGECEEHTSTICMLDAIDRKSQSTDECFNCPIASGCAWCSAYNYEEFCTPNKRATYICIMHKARVLANSYYWNKLYMAIEIDKRVEINIPKEWAVEIVSELEYEHLIELSKID